jgi:hypothetical protein
MPKASCECGADRSGVHPDLQDISKLPVLPA